MMPEPESEDPQRKDPRRSIPAVGRLLSEPPFRRLVEVYGERLVGVQLRRQLKRAREGTDPGASELSSEGLAASVGAELELLGGPPLRRVINATGIFLHTNLGRAPLPRDVAGSHPSLLDAACDLEIDLGSGRRGDRNRRAEKLLRELTGAAAGLVVNNNAAALVLALAALARGRDVVVSRGELVEIGGSFRIPDILAAAGVELVEVGTTNRTRLEDYRRALGERTGLLLKVHPSNYRIRGFVKSVREEDLVELGRRHGVPVLVDEGSGLLVPHPAPQLADHRSHRELVAAGCDLVCGSGDKLLGGPQAGLMVGSAEVVESCRRHPLYRAMRPSRATFIALEPMLRRWLFERELPIDRLWQPAAELRKRLERMAASLGSSVGAEIVEADAFLGGGAAPEAPIPGEALALPGKSSLLRALRAGAPPVIGYLKRDRLILDLRTVHPADDDDLVAAVCAVIGSRSARERSRGGAE